MNCMECNIPMEIKPGKNRKPIAVLVCPKCKMEKPVHFDHPMFNKTVPGLIGPENGKPVVGLRG